MLDNILLLTRQLLTIPSLSGDVEKSVAILELIKQELPEYKPMPFVSNSIPSLLYSNKDHSTKHFKIILNAHVDVVPGALIMPYEEDGKLYGRGAYDMKGAAAVMILLFKELAPKVDYPLGLQLITDEEIGGEDGVKYQLQKGIRTDFVITGECGSNFRIVHESKARLVVKLIAKGRISHSAYPWRGINAVNKLHETLAAIFQEYPFPAKEEYVTTLNVTRIITPNTERRESGYNRTPDHCEALLDIRYIPKDRDTILTHLNSLLGDGVTMEVLHNSAPHQTLDSHPYVKELQKITSEHLQKDIELGKAHATSDVRHFSEVGNDGVEFGPIGQNQHTDGEWVDIKSLEDYYQIMKKFLLSVK